jgi:anti-sigma B factor antagonist
MSSIAAYRRDPCGLSILTDDPTAAAPTARRGRTPVAERLAISAAIGLRHVVVAVAGDLDAVTVQQFRDELMRQVPAARRRLVVDLSGLQFMDTSAIHVLVRVNNRVMAGGGLLVLAGAQPVVARVLSLAGADEVMPVVGSVAEALALT